MEEKGSRIVNKKNEIMKERVKKEQAECTFTPKINKTIHFPKENRKEKVDRNIDGLLKWGQEKDMRLAGKRMLQGAGKKDD